MSEFSGPAIGPVTWADAVAGAGVGWWHQVGHQVAHQVGHQTGHQAASAAPPGPRAGPGGRVLGCAAAGAAWGPCGAPSGRAAENPGSGRRAAGGRLLPVHLVPRLPCCCSRNFARPREGPGRSSRRRWTVDNRAPNWADAGPGGRAGTTPSSNPQKQARVATASSNRQKQPAVASAVHAAWPAGPAPARHRHPDRGAHPKPNSPPQARTRTDQPINRQDQGPGEGLSEFLRPRPGALSCGDTGPGRGAVCSQDTSRGTPRSTPQDTPRGTPQDTDRPGPAACRRTWPGCFGGALRGPGRGGPPKGRGGPRGAL